MEKYGKKQFEDVSEKSNPIKANNLLALTFTKHRLRRIRTNPIMSTPFMTEHTYLALNLRPCLLKTSFISSS